MNKMLTYEELLERRKSTLDGWLGIDIVEIDEQRVVMTMPVTEKIHQPGGVVHHRSLDEAPSGDRRPDPARAEGGDPWCVPRGAHSKVRSDKR